MSDKPQRTIEQIQLDYQNVALKAGHTAYQIYTFEKELDLFNGQLRDLNLEAAAVNAAKQKADAEAAKAKEAAAQAQAAETNQSGAV